MTTMRISIDVLNKIVAQDNMTAYRNGFQIRNRFVVIKPLTNILYEHDPLLKSSMVVQNARHNPGSGAYLSINISCKKCKDMAYKIQLLRKPDEADKEVDLELIKKGEHQPEKHLDIPWDKVKQQNSDSEMFDDSMCIKDHHQPDNHLALPQDKVNDSEIFEEYDSMYINDPHQSDNPLDIPEDKVNDSETFDDPEPICPICCNKEFNSIDCYQQKTKFVLVHRECLKIRYNEIYID